MQIGLHQFVIKLIICYIQICYIQFCANWTRNTNFSTPICMENDIQKKFLKSAKTWPPLIPRYAGIHKISTKEYGVHAKHTEKIVYNLNNTIPHNVCLVDP
jgi:hypothetical protein